MTHKNTVKTQRAKENSTILEETQSQCTVGCDDKYEAHKNSEKLIKKSLIFLSHSADRPTCGQ